MEKFVRIGSKQNPISAIWDIFSSLDKFTKFFLITILFFIVFAAYITNHTLNTRQRASSMQKVYWGVEVPSWNTNNFQTTTDLETLVNKKVSILGYYTSWGQQYPNFPTSLMEGLRQRGTIALVSWEPDNDPLVVNDSSYTLLSIINGSHDAYITKYAQDAKAWGKPFFLRFAYEMNGNWTPWSEGVNGNTSGQYVQAWRHVHDIFTQVGATNATWVWSPNTEDSKSTPLEGLYPGDSYVDWVALDGYNWGTTQSWSTWQTFDQVFRASYNHVEQISPNKPFMVAETAAPEQGGDKAAWISDAYTTQVVNNYPNLKAILWFDFNKGVDWRINSSTTSLAAFSNAISSDVYASNDFALINTSPIQSYVINLTTPTITPTPSSTPPIKLDTAPPSSSVVSPAQGSFVGRLTTVTVSSNASDNVGISKVETYINGTLTCTTTVQINGFYNCKWKVSGKKNTSYTITSKAYDSSGNTSVSSTINVMAK